MNEQNPNQQPQHPDEWQQPGYQPQQPFSGPGTPPGYGYPPQPPNGPAGPYFAPQGPPPRKKHTGRNIVLAVVGVLAFFLVVAVVNGVANQPTGSSAGPVAQNVPADTPSSVPDESSAPPADEPSDSGSPDLNDQTARIGDQWYGWTDGVRAKVSTEQVTSPGEFDDTASDGTYYKVKVTFKNGSGQALDTSLCSVNVSYGSDGDSADPSFNTETDSTCEGSILPGRKKSFTFAFSITEQQAQDVVIEVAPDWDHTSAYFTNDGN